MKYFIAKVKYKEPVPDSDKEKKVTKKFLVRAETVTEVEIKVTQWFPANWKDAEVKSVNETPIQELIKQGESETWWQFKIMFEDTDSGKWTPYVLAANGGTIEIGIPRVKNAHSMAEIEAVQKLKVELDSDLLT